jgi:hypothetical protein
MHGAAPAVGRPLRAAAPRAALRRPRCSDVLGAVASLRSRGFRILVVERSFLALCAGRGAPGVGDHGGGVPSHRPALRRLPQRPQGPRVFHPPTGAGRPTRRAGAPGRGAQRRGA